MAEIYLEPAATIIQKLGGLEPTAEAARVSVSRVCRWRKPKELGGTGGLIPSGRQQPLIDWARSKGIELEPADFFASVKNRKPICSRHVA
jgi:hypothetical protein